MILSGDKVANLKEVVVVEVTGCVTTVTVLAISPGSALMRMKVEMEEEGVVVEGEEVVVDSGKMVRPPATIATERDILLENVLKEKGEIVVTEMMSQSVTDAKMLDT